MTTSNRLGDILSDARDCIELLLEQEREQTAIERALADDLATVLSRTVVGWEVDLTKYPDVQRVMARYREARK